jgi:hypothetical protein
MLLVDAIVRGFRRFGSETDHKLLVDARMACIIGANEAGKSSLLKLLAESRNGTAIPNLDRTRREHVGDDDVIIKLHYRLDASDQDAVAKQYVGQRLPDWFTVSKTAGGRITIDADQVARRDRAHRKRLVDALDDPAIRARLTAPNEREDDDAEVAAAEPLLSGDYLDNIAAHLGENVENLPPELLAEWGQRAGSLRSAGEEVLSDLFGDVIESEAANHPRDAAAHLLWTRTPDFVSFAERDRDLSSEYNLEEVAADPPIALKNLARLAGVDLAEILALIQADESGTVEGLERQANDRLAEVFAKWSQRPGIQVTIKFMGTMLNIHVATGRDVPMKLRERSDGLRQFVALVAASVVEAEHGPSILLIDEIETHLHYDAQADLLSILADQTQATVGQPLPPIGQIIYTTHSAACLPDDLGSVRIAQAASDRTRSVIRNQFWTDEPGLGPLLMAMGAATLAFVPRRAALIAEGPSELILLPTLIRQAVDMEHIGYQIAPGASGVRPGSIMDFHLEAPRTVWVVDSDEGGRAIADKLRKDGIDDELILALGGDDAGLILESLVDTEAYRDAFAAYLRDKGSSEEPPTVEELETVDRPARLGSYCQERGIRPPSKVIMANKLLAMRSERTLVASDHIATLVALHQAAVKLLGPPPP